MGTDDAIREAWGGWVRAMRSGLRRAGSDSATIRDEAERLLINWGRWCRDDWHKQLGYTVPPTSRDYRAPRQEVPTRYLPPIVADEAWTAQEAIARIGARKPTTKREIHPFETYEFIAMCYAFQRTEEYIARKLKCSTRTVRRRKVQAQETFWDEYHEVRREKKRVA